ncbi:unnamed protein product [Lactuca virosa]|uniref:RAB6-interacting golgin n=1 Tax=Lactuca virosa TaxID=75947 RepID=A0AAU9NRE2_9ASTR|nr:unnamed protein product [Lactuca virosa]
MVQKIKKNKRQLEDPLDKFNVETDNGSDSKRSDIRIDDSRLGSPRRDSPIKSIFEETGNPGANTQENHLRSLVESIEKQQVERPEVHAKCFEYDIQKPRDVAKEHHDLFVEKLKTMKESVDLKMAELKSEMAKEVDKIEKIYFVLHGKVDVATDPIVKLLDYNTTYSTNLDVKSDQDSKVFAKLEEFFSSIKESVSKIDISTQSTVS